VDAAAGAGTVTVAVADTAGGSELAALLRLVAGAGAPGARRYEGSSPACSRDRRGAGAGAEGRSDEEISAAADAGVATAGAAAGGGAGAPSADLRSAAGAPVSRPIS
jgi:hypothetical protein